jgi:tRNA(Ile)-lysidine synthase
MVSAAVARGGFCAPDPRIEAYIDARVVDGPLVIRGPAAGDRIRPLGAPGERLVQDVLVDLRVPACLRARIPLVVCANRVIWLCGLVQSQESRIVRDTERVVRLSVAAHRGSKEERG